jgi:hypothetical protein
MELESTSRPQYGSVTELERRAKAEWSKIAGEPIGVKYIKGVLYAFGSELACLRLEHHMRCGRANYSENMGTWYWAKEALA